jgi:hypothetical protein
MKSLLTVLLLSLGFGTAMAADQSNCYREACVGDQAINVTNNYREVTILGIDNYGKFVLRFLDNGGVGGNWDRDDLALERGCSGDLCVGYPAIDISNSYRRVTVHALQTNGKFVLRFDDNAGVGGNWDRSDLAVGWGCVGNFCVNDTVYNRTNNRQATVAGVQIADRLVLDYGASGLGGNWQTTDLVLLERGPTAYPPGGPVPPPNPYCPPGTHWDPRANGCVSNAPPPNPYCPPGTHWDPRLNSCVSNAPPPPNPPVCPWGTHWDPRADRCVQNPNPPPMPIPPAPSPRQWECRISHPGHVYLGRGSNESGAIDAVLHSCSVNGGACRAYEAVCRPL